MPRDILAIVDQFIATLTLSGPSSSGAGNRPNSNVKRTGRERDMTAPESSLSRWSRLKREAVSKSRAAADQDDTPACPDGSQDTVPEAALDERLVDPDELPSIDTITIDTDIRAFLKSRVQAELTRAALRLAWIRIRPFAISSPSA